MFSFLELPSVLTCFICCFWEFWCASILFDIFVRRTKAFPLSLKSNRFTYVLESIFISPFFQVLGIPFYIYIQIFYFWKAFLVIDLNISCLPLFVDSRDSNYTGVGFCLPFQALSHWFFFFFIYFTYTLLVFFFLSSMIFIQLSFKYNLQSISLI